TIGKAFGNSSPSREDYLDILKLQYEIFSFMRKNGAVALDEHVGDVAKSSIFSKYPSFLKRHHAVEFFRDALKQIVNGTASPEELDVLLDAELEEAWSGKYLRCIKEDVIASLKGAAPIVAVEFARKAIFSDERPSSDETDAACRAVKAAAG